MIDRILGFLIIAGIVGLMGGTATYCLVVKPCKRAMKMLGLLLTCEGEA